MKSLRMAIYASILIRFLRKASRKLSPDGPRITPGNTRGHPVQVGVEILYTNLHPSPGGGKWGQFEYFRVATCIDLETASDLANTLNDMEPGYGHRFSLIDPDEEITGRELETLATERIRLIRPNIRRCPDPDRLAKIMNSAATSVLFNKVCPHG